MTTSKVLVELILPAANSKFDIYIPLDSKMSEVKMLVAGILDDLANGKIKAGESSVICNAESGFIYNVNMTIADLGIKNGTRLMLI